MAVSVWGVCCVCVFMPDRTVTSAVLHMSVFVSAGLVLTVRSWVTCSKRLVKTVVKSPMAN